MQKIIRIALTCILVPLYAEEVRTFPVHFSVLCGRERVVAAATPEKLAEQIAILNKHFHDASGQPIARFELKSISTYEQIKDSHCQNIIGRANSPVHTAGSLDVYSGKVGICTDPKVFDPGAINVFIIDTWANGKGWESQTSYGNVHNYQPYLAIDWSWLNGEKPPRIPIIVHEMGHAFFLHDEKSKGDNIMEDGSHSEYFRPDQTVTMFKSSNKILKILTSYDLENLILNPGFETGSTYWTMSKNNFSERFAWAGSRSVELLPGTDIAQTVHLAKSGTYRFQCMAQTYKPGSSVTLSVNGKVAYELAIQAGGNKDYNPVIVEEIALQAKDQVEIRVNSANISRVDDFSLKWLR